MSLRGSKSMFKGKNSMQRGNSQRGLPKSKSMMSQSTDTFRSWNSTRGDARRRENSPPNNCCYIAVRGSHNRRKFLSLGAFDETNPSAKDRRITELRYWNAFPFTSFNPGKTYANTDNKLLSDLFIQSEELFMMGLYFYRQRTSELDEKKNFKLADKYMDRLTHAGINRIAMQYWCRAARLGHADAIYALALMFLHGTYGTHMCVNCSLPLRKRHHKIECGHFSCSSCLPSNNDKSYGPCRLCNVTGATVSPSMTLNKIPINISEVERMNFYLSLSVASGDQKGQKLRDELIERGFIL